MFQVQSEACLENETQMDCKDLRGLSRTVPRTSEL